LKAGKKVPEQTRLSRRSTGEASDWGGRIPFDEATSVEVHKPDVVQIGDGDV
jgi:hypothetical protein